MDFSKDLQRILEERKAVEKICRSNSCEDCGGWDNRGREDSSRREYGCYLMRSFVGDVREYLSMLDKSQSAYAKNVADSLSNSLLLNNKEGTTQSLVGLKVALETMEEREIPEEELPPPLKLRRINFSKFPRPARIAYS
jgi:hypothetical protein